MFFLTKDVLDYNALHISYCSLMLPVFSYCVELWGMTLKTINPIVMLQKKRVIGVINKSGYYDHTEPLFLRFDMMKLV